MNDLKIVCADMHMHTFFWVLRIHKEKQVQY